MSGSMLMENDV